MSVPSSKLAPPAPSPASECVPPLEPKGGQHLLRVRGWGSQFGRLDRKSGTLSTLWISIILKCNLLILVFLGQYLGHPYVAAYLQQQLTTTVGHQHTAPSSHPSLVSSAVTSHQTVSPHFSLVGPSITPQQTVPLHSLGSPYSLPSLPVKNDTAALTPAVSKH